MRDSIDERENAQWRNEIIEAKRYEIKRKKGSIYWNLLWYPSQKWSNRRRLTSIALVNRRQFGQSFLTGTFIHFIRFLTNVWNGTTQYIRLSLPEIALGIDCIQMIPKSNGGVLVAFPSRHTCSDFDAMATFFPRVTIKKNLWNQVFVCLHFLDVSQD